MEVSGKLNERLGAHQGVFQEYSAGGASRATTLFAVLVLVSEGNRAAILVAIFDRRRRRRRVVRNAATWVVHGITGTCLRAEHTALAYSLFCI